MRSHSSFSDPLISIFNQPPSHKHLWNSSPLFFAMATLLCQPHIICLLWLSTLCVCPPFHTLILPFIFHLSPQDVSLYYIIFMWKFFTKSKTLQQHTKTSSVLSICAQFHSPGSFTPTIHLNHTKLSASPGAWCIQL